MNIATLLTAATLVAPQAPAQDDLSSIAKCYAMAVTEVASLDDTASAQQELTAFGLSPQQEAERRRWKLLGFLAGREFYRTVSKRGLPPPEAQKIYQTARMRGFADDDIGWCFTRFRMPAPNDPTEP